MKQHYTDQDMKIAILESNSNNLLSTLNRIELSIRDMDKKFEDRFNKLDTRLDKLDSRLWFIAFFLIATYGSVIAILWKGFKL